MCIGRVGDHVNSQSVSKNNFGSDSLERSRSLNTTSDSLQLYRYYLMYMHSSHPALRRGHMTIAFSRDNVVLITVRISSLRGAIDNE